MKKAVLSFLLALLFSSALQAQGSSTSAVADRNRILIGERLQLTIRGLAIPGKGNWPDIDTIPHFEIMERSKIDTIRAISGSILQQTLTLTSWDSGRWAIAPIRIFGGRTNGLIIDVAYTPMEPDQPYHDIKDILQVQKPIASNWKWYLLGIALLLILFLLFFPRNREKRAKPVPPEDVYNNVLKRLAALRASDEPSGLYTEMVHLFRYYLEKRKGISSLSKTTDDIAVQLRSLQLPAGNYTELVQVLRLSDLVKFARYQPGTTENEQSLEVIRKNIQNIEQLK